jgi:signal transduction histidine kinase
MTVQAVIPLLAAAAYLILLILIAINRPQTRQQKHFMVYLVAVSIWEISEAFLLSDFWVEYKLIIFRAVICSSVWWAIQLYVFVRAYLNMSVGIITRVAYALLLLLVIFAFAGQAPPSVIIENSAFVSPQYGWWFVLYVVPLILVFVMGVFMLIKRIRYHRDPEERNKISYLITAVVILAGFGFIGVTPLALKGGIPFSHIGGLSAAFVLAYAISRHGLVSISAVLRQVIGWTLLFVVGICSYALALFLFSIVFDFVLSYEALLFATLTAVLAALFVYFLRPTFSTMIDYFFYRETYLYRQILLRFDTEMGTILSLDELADRMLSVIVKAMNIPRAVLLFQNETDNYFVARYVHPEGKGSTEDIPTFVQGNPIITWLEKENGVLYLNQIDTMMEFRGLWYDEKQVLRASGLDLLCPLKSRGKLVGILALENKKSRKPFSQEDIEMIKGMAGKAGIIVENARMFDALSQQQLQVQRLLSDAIHARESERQRISVDLHDSVAQWLAGASYQAQTVEALLPKDGNQKIREQISTLENTIEKSLKELRRVVVDLRPPALDELGLSHALRQSLGSLTNEGIKCSFSEEGDGVRLSPEVEITVYRVVQEAFTNIRKHAGASKVDLKIEYRRDKLTVRIQDNGKGFDFDRTMRNAISVGNMGLLGMRQRVTMIGGTMEIRTRSGGGTLIIMNLPVKREQEGISDEQNQSISD